MNGIEGFYTLLYLPKGSVRWGRAANGQRDPFMIKK